MRADKYKNISNTIKKAIKNNKKLLHILEFSKHNTFICAKKFRQNYSMKCKPIQNIPRFNQQFDIVKMVFQRKRFHDK